MKFWFVVLSIPLLESAASTRSTSFNRQYSYLLINGGAKNNITTPTNQNRTASFKFSPRKNKYVRVDDDGTMSDDQSIDKVERSNFLRRLLTLDKWATIEDAERPPKKDKYPNSNMTQSDENSFHEEDINNRAKTFPTEINKRVERSENETLRYSTHMHNTDGFELIGSKLESQNSTILEKDQSSDLDSKMKKIHKNDDSSVDTLNNTTAVTPTLPSHHVPKKNVTTQPGSSPMDPDPTVVTRRVNAMDLFGPPPPLGMSMSSPLLIIPGQPPMRQHQSPPSSKEATIASIISLLIPVLSRLVVLTLLSGSSLFGHGDNYIYSPNPTQHFMFERLNDRYMKDGMAMKTALGYAPRSFSKHVWGIINNRRKKATERHLLEKKKVNGKSSTSSHTSQYTRTLIVYDVQTTDKDMESVVEELRDAITFIIHQYHDAKSRIEMGTDLEVVVRIESPGGVVHEFGLASDQLSRLKFASVERNDLKLTICVDKIAASGGYMMACQASEGQLFCAPWAVIGSIGVLRETINVHDLLQKYNIRPLLLKSGDAKVPLTATSKVTKQSIELVEKNLQKVHEAFKNMIKTARGDNILHSFDQITSGDTFLGKEAKDLGLVDRVITSDEYLYERVEKGDRVLKLHKYDKSRMMMRLSPLDLLLLRTDDIFGKRVSNALRVIAKVGSEVMKMCATFGAVQLVDKNCRGNKFQLLSGDNYI